MQNRDTQRQRLVDYAGLFVIGMAVVLVTLCLGVSLMIMLGKESHEARPLLTVSAGQESIDRSYSLPSDVI